MWYLLFIEPFVLSMCETRKKSLSFRIVLYVIRCTHRLTQHLKKYFHLHEIFNKSIEHSNISYFANHIFYDLTKNTIYLHILNTNLLWQWILISLTFNTKMCPLYAVHWKNAIHWKINSEKPGNICFYQETWIRKGRNKSNKLPLFSAELQNEIYAN